MNVAPSIFPLEIIAVSFENCMEHTNALCGHNAEFSNIKACASYDNDRLCGLVVRVLGYRSRGPGSIPGTTKKKVVGLERGPLSLVSATEELLDRKVASPV
jgi:hypothetical protein